MRKPRVIIYDDDAMVLDMLERFFSERGYEVDSYSSVVVCKYENITGSCENLSPCADIIISDFVMPKMTGIELFQRQLERGCKVDMKMKAIMSGYSDEKLVKQCEKLGCRFFAKPFAFSELSGWLSECEKNFDLSRQLNDRRVTRRYYLKKDIEYRVNPAISKEIFMGITVDKNNEGLGLRIFNPLRSGEEITIIKGFENTPVKGVVKWCRKQGENTYIAGLQLLDNIAIMKTSIAAESAEK